MHSDFQGQPQFRLHGNQHSSDLSQEGALAELRRIQRHTVSIDHATPIHGVSTLQPRQAQVLAALKINKPTIDAQLTLL